MKHKTTALIILMWVSIGAVHALSRYTDIVKYNIDVAFSMSDVGYYALSYASWTVLTLALIRVLSVAKSSLSYRRLAALFIVGLVVWLPSYFAYDYAIATWVANGGWAEWVDRFRATSGSVMFFYGVVYALTFALCVSFVFSARAREAQLVNIALERQTARATLELAEQQMQLMQSQLSPHFLFNALGAISYLARRGERDALNSAVAKLGGLLRFTIQNASQSTIPVLDELQFSKDYISLQSLRFGERFDCVFEHDPNLESMQCLPFSLQPMLENVFQHVVEQFTELPDGKTQSKISIRVSVKLHNDRVFMRVQNTRPATQLSSTPSMGHGTGMKNLETRLTHVFGSDFSLSNAESPADFQVELSFPSALVVEHV
ncbi:MAG: sensor histidine kinase [Gammaproteobacteria bacterium]